MDIYFFIQNQIDLAKKAGKTVHADNQEDLTADFWATRILTCIENAGLAGIDAQSLITTMTMLQNKQRLQLQLGINADPHVGKALNATPEFKKDR